MTWIDAGGPWLPGMLTADGYRVVGQVVDESGLDDDDEEYLCLAEGPKGIWAERILCELAKDYRIDPDDPATLGVMLGEVRRVWDEPRAYLNPRPNGRWGLRLPLRRESFSGPTEAAVLALAIAARPGLEKK